MNLPTEVFGDVVVVHTPDELGADQCDHFETYVSMLEQVKVIVDLDGTEMIDSLGLTALLNCQETLRQVNGDIRISTTNPVNRKILEITRLDQELEVYENVIDAVKSFA